MATRKKTGSAIALPAQNGLFATVSGLIDTVLLFWRIGEQKIVVPLATQLIQQPHGHTGQMKP